jgi:hypothetical protein
MSVEPSKPDVAAIAVHSREIYRAGEVSRDATIKALRAVEQQLKCDFKLAPGELKPVTDLITEIEAEA